MTRRDDRARSEQRPPPASVAVTKLGFSVDDGIELRIAYHREVLVASMRRPIARYGRRPQRVRS